MKQQAVIEYDIEGLTNESLALMAKQAKTFTIGPKGEGYDDVVTAHRQAKKLYKAVSDRGEELKRPNIEKRKTLLAENKEHDKNANKWLVIIEPIKLMVGDKRKEWEDKLEAIRAEKIKAEEERVEGIKLQIESYKSSAIIDPGMTAKLIQERLDAINNTGISEDVFAEFTDQALLALSKSRAIVEECLSARTAWENEQAAIKIEADRLAAQKVEQQAAQAKIDTDNKRIAKANAKLEAGKKEADNIKWRNRVSQLKGSTLDCNNIIDPKTGDQIISDKEIYSLSDADFEKTAKAWDKTIADREAVIEAARTKKAEKDAAEKVECEAREAEEKAETEAAEVARVEALRPDKEKLEAVALQLELTCHTFPAVTYPSAGDILDGLTHNLLDLAAGVRADAEEL